MREDEDCFFTWMFLHVLVAIIGFLNKDYYNNARHTFGVTYGKRKPPCDDPSLILRQLLHAASL